jgi:hypothetical protein
MPPSERRRAAPKILAKLEQQLAACEMLVAEPILADD